MAEIYLKRKKCHYIPNKKRKEAQRIYNTVRWVELRNWYIRNNPLCEDCAEQDLVVPAVEIHHVIDFMSGKDKWDRIRLAYDSDNLRSLCTPCHHKKHPNINSQ